MYRNIQIYCLYLLFLSICESDGFFLNKFKQAYKHLCFLCIGGVKVKVYTNNIYIINVNKFFLLCC
ncbi:hypothetical protein EZS27_028056 [termite gut metagenome]|uniref:Uncharacterized protein n=1 Tax=termite gut metagenome TaxID=433724 RepID=A0A5J4QKH2_9ZZZZ